MVRPTLSVVPEQDECVVPEQDECVVPERDECVVPERNRSTTDEDFWTGQPSQATPIGDADWTLRAVCVAVDPDALFVTGAAQRDAAKVCQACPVRLECLADALDNQIEYGVWGGMTERQRRAVLKKSPEVTSWRLVLEEARASATQDAAS